MRWRIWLWRKVSPVWGVACLMLGAMDLFQALTGISLSRGYPHEVSRSGSLISAGLLFAAASAIFVAVEIGRRAHESLLAERRRGISPDPLKPPPPNP